MEDYSQASAAALMLQIINICDTHLQTAGAVADLEPEKIEDDLPVYLPPVLAICGACGCVIRDFKEEVKAMDEQKQLEAGEVVGLDALHQEIRELRKKEKQVDMLKYRLRELEEAAQGHQPEYMGILQRQEAEEKLKLVSARSAELDKREQVLEPLEASLREREQKLAQELERLAREKMQTTPAPSPPPPLDKDPRVVNTALHEALKAANQIVQESKEQLSSLEQELAAEKANREALEGELQAMRGQSNVAIESPATAGRRHSSYTTSAAGTVESAEKPIRRRSDASADDVVGAVNTMRSLRPSNVALDADKA